MTDPWAITDTAGLRAVIGEPSERIRRMKFATMDAHVQRFIAHAPLVMVATHGPDGLDCSPRGGRPVLHVLDDRHLVLPEWPGNKRADSLSNLLADDHIGLVCLFPPLNVFLRLNGRATLTRDPELLARCAEGDRQPLLAVRIAVAEAYFHCGKAILRSGLYDPTTWITPGTLPSLGQVNLDQSARAGLDTGTTTAEEKERAMDAHMRETLY